MFTIEDDDLPITVAQKIVSGTKPNKNEGMKALTNLVIGEGTGDTVDMFSLEDIEEIAEYLMVYCKTHSNGD